MSKANYYDSPSWILQLAGCSSNQVLKFSRSNNKPSRTSQLTGINDELLKSNAFGAIGGINIIAYGVSKKATYICPECLKQSAYARLFWDFRINKVCPIHRCNLVNRCPQCHQTIRWSRHSVVKCNCGFDFREALATRATDSQVHFSLYRYGYLGKAECMKSIKEIYGEDNPLFCLTFEQFVQLSRFLKFEIGVCLRHQGDLAMSQDILSRFDMKPKALSSEELVFDFFKDWKRNINYLFQWHEKNSIRKNSTAHTILVMVFRLVEFSSLLPISCFLSKQLEIALRKYLNDYNVMQIEITYGYLDDYYGEKLDLNKIDNWLPRISRMLDCPEPSLSRLIWVCQHIKSIRWLKDCSAWQIVLNRPLPKLIKLRSRFFHFMG